VTELRFRKRHRLRQKEVVALARELDTILGTRTFSEADIVDMAEGPGYDAVFAEGRILAFVVDGSPFLTVRGLLRFGAQKRYVTVDMGAVKFVYNGADVMGPGIVDADPEIRPGDLVWVRDIKNRQPLAVGRAIVDTKTMALKEKGKAVEAVHHVGDKLWLADEQKEKEKKE
jgi:PUA-domain protein